MDLGFSLLKSPSPEHCCWVLEGKGSRRTQETPMHEWARVYYDETKTFADLWISRKS